MVTNPPVASLRIDGHDLSQLKTWVEPYEVDACMVSSTAVITPEMREQIAATGIQRIHYLDHTTPLPIRNSYSTPETLGTDRLAASVGAYFLAAELKKKHVPVLVIDLGTALTFDLVTAEGEYLGGNISPGIQMRLKALHQFTARLPKVNPEGPLPALGNSTETAIRCGVIHGIQREIEGAIRQFSVNYPQLLVFLTGGDTLDFAKPLKKHIFADKFLVAKGLNIILMHNS